MFTYSTCKNKLLNTKLNDYCKDVMNNAIKNITEKSNLEKSKDAAIIPNYDCNILSFIFGFLSGTVITFYLYKKVK